MKIEEIKNLSGDDLRNKLKTLQNELYKLNFQKQSGQIDKPHRFRLVRKDIARIKTVLNSLTKNKQNQATQSWKKQHT